ncbi:scoloptoxin SSD43-like [Diabrotica undecimpunctata]|uniref:scoloptoxin SSD43-like n=1 Tax=Diabrotica undecimpunctata TaxID=50387 RepID=UPI003B63533F
MILHIKLTLLIILIISNINYSFDDLEDCIDEWPRCIDKSLNVVCKRKGTCRPLDNDCVSLEMDNDFRNHILKEHNSFRNYIASGKEKRNGATSASNMMVLNYDFDLEFSATCTANKCEMKRDHCRRTRRFWYVGTNLYRGSLETSLEKEAVNNWYSEIVYMDPEVFPRYIVIQKASNFTQVVWARTTHIGCGRAHSEGNYYLACNYGPSGNKLYRSVYKTGQPASNCPYNVNKSRKYPNLCGIAYEVNVAINLHDIHDIIYGYMFISLFVVFFINK